MVKIVTSNKNIDSLPSSVTRVEISNVKPSSHRFVETAKGHTIYRVGVGDFSEVTPRSFRTLIRSIVHATKNHQVEALALTLNPQMFPQLAVYDTAWFWRTIAENLAIAAYEFARYKTKKERGVTLQSITVCGAASAAAQSAFKEGLIIAASVNAARDIANTTGADMNPSGMVAAAKKLAAGSGIKITVHNKTKLKQLKMGLLEGVGKGAHDGPYLLVMEYFGAGKKVKSKPTILIGKGVTYDTGGLNLKPTGALHDMHMDMSGGAAVIGAIVGAAKLKLKKDVVAIVPIAENAISDKSMRTGDILTSMSGLTVEVLNTDAEGRLILADAYTYAQKYYSPHSIIDVATLTGAALVALGQHASAVFSKDDTLRNTLTELGEESGDLVWPLPLWDEYKQYLKGNRGDITNMNGPANRFGGAIEGASFLSFFAPKKVPWAHIDMAPRMDAVPSDKLAKGATGEPVRLLLRYLSQ